MNYSLTKMLKNLTMAREAGRLTADLHLFFLSSKSCPSLGLILNSIADNLLMASPSSLPLSQADHMESFTPNFPLSTHFFVPDPNSPTPAGIP